MSGTFGHVTRENLALYTDLYELAMAQGYRRTGHEPEATFDLFFRELPPDRGYVVAAGLEQVVSYLDSLSFGPRAISYLSGIGFEEEFLSYLEGFEFTGDVRAIPEGTPVFPDEPVVEVTAPVTEAQLFETLLINQVGFQSLIATKAARMVDAARRGGSDASIVDFGSRRAHGTDAGVKAARAAYISGFSGTSNVAAGEAFSIPVFGTMAHSWVQSFPTEREAFEAFVSVYGEESVLLVDTYDTIEGAKTAVEVAEEAGVDIRGVRIDSGDLTALSRRVSDVVGDLGVFVSSGIDEYEIEGFLESGGVASGFGPGTALATSADAPDMEAVYKLVAVERDGRPRPTMKLSSGKETYPGEKSVRRIEEGGEYRGDVLGLRGEGGPGEEQLVPVFEDGTLVYDPPDLEEVRERARREVGRLPGKHRRLRDPVPYEVSASEGLREVRDRTRGAIEARR